MTIHCGTQCGQWVEEKVKKSLISRSLNVSVNPEKKMEDNSAIIQFTTYLSYFIKVLQALTRYYKVLKGTTSLNPLRHLLLCTHILFSQVVFCKVGFAVVRCWLNT